MCVGESYEHLVSVGGVPIEDFAEWQEGQAVKGVTVDILVVDGEGDDAIVAIVLEIESGKRGNFGRAENYERFFFCPCP